MVQLHQSGATTVTEGEMMYTFKITPDKTHKVADVLVNGESVGAVTSYTLKDVKERCDHRCEICTGSIYRRKPFQFPDRSKWNSNHSRGRAFCIKECRNR